MIITGVIAEFCEHNQDNWQWQHDYDENGERIMIANKQLHEGFCSIEFYKSDVTNIIIESNILVIVFYNKVIIDLGGDTNIMQVISTDLTNPLIKKE